jgi:DNA invertase Pin-like site-specific DNA recombinase
MANRVKVHILAAGAEHEWEMISRRTKASLAAAKVRGVLLWPGVPRPRPCCAGAGMARLMQLAGQAGALLDRQCGPTVDPCASEHWGIFGNKPPCRTVVP